jgi:hypothetical protein
MRQSLFPEPIWWALPLPFTFRDRRAKPGAAKPSNRWGPSQWSALAVPMDRLWLLCCEVPPGGPLTGQVVDHLDELAWLAFWRDHVMASIGGTERDDVGHQPGTAARSRTRDIARRA